MREPIQIDPDIRRARTLPADCYARAAFDLQVKEMFPRTWQLAPLDGQVPAPGHAAPWTFMEGTVEVPLMVVRRPDGGVRVLSNVCTHRGMLLLAAAGPLTSIQCRYHGRRFDLDGRFVFMPGFEGVPGFPDDDDHLPRLPCAQWGPLIFASLEPGFSGDELLAPLRERLGWLPLDAFRPAPAGCRDYEVGANWALYCDNYLEGFHVPYVHRSLAAALDPKAYRTELLDWGTLQIGMAAAGQPAFELPAGHVDEGRRVGGYYFFLFPNTMLNFYPWGLSVNVVLPRGPGRTTVRYQTWIWKEELLGTGAGGDLHRVELEDGAVVEGVQQGIRSRLYHRGRYSPVHETGVHHFHRLLARFMNEALARAAGTGAR